MSLSLAQFRLLDRIVRGERLPCDRYRATTGTVGALAHGTKRLRARLGDKSNGRGPFIAKASEFRGDRLIMMHWVATRRGLKRHAEICTAGRQQP